MVEQKVDSDDEFKDCVDDFAARKNLTVNFSSLFPTVKFRERVFDFLR